MILGVGVDMCRIARMSRLVSDRHFLERVFSDEEIAYALARPDPARHLAASFAAREAFSKASGVNLARVVFRGVSVRRSDRGPSIKLGRMDLSIRQLVEGHRFHLSLSHDGEYAVAFVVMEEGPNRESP